MKTDNIYELSKDRLLVTREILKPNDFYGHAKGDFVIQSLGKNIDRLLSEKESKVYHLQGDEFVIFNKNVDQAKFTENIRYIVSNISKDKAIIIDD